MAESPIWRCHEDIPTEQLKQEVQTNGLELEVNPGGVFFYLKVGREI